MPVNATTTDDGVMLTKSTVDIADNQTKAASSDDEEFVDVDTTIYFSQASSFNQKVVKPDMKSDMKYVVKSVTSFGTNAETVNVKAVSTMTAS